jgi:hypothetical protein
MQTRPSPPRSTFGKPSPCSALADLEPPTEPPDSEGGGGIGSFLNSTRGIISSITALIAAVTGLLIALNKTGILDGGNGGGATTTTTETAGPFGAMARPPIGRVYFDGGAMYVRANLPRQRLLHLADQDDALRDVALRARVTKVSGANDYGMSFLCRYVDSRNYYVLGVLSGRRYNIARYRDGRLVSLTGGPRRNSAIEPKTNEITVRCVGDDPTTLTLEVNGQVVATRRDADGIESGNVGLRVGSDESFVTFRFENVLLSYL